MKQAPLSRRAFLRGAGGTVLTLPYLDFFAGRARAQTTIPQRLVVVMHGQGTVARNWTPSGTGGNFSLSPILSALGPHQSKINVLSGIDNIMRNEVRREINGHHTAGRTLMTCWPYAGSVNADGTIRSAGEQSDFGPAFGPSFEHVIANGMAGQTRFLRLDCQAGPYGPGENQIFWGDNRVQIDGEPDPRVVFNRLTAEITPPEEAPVLSPADRFRMQRGSVLDSVLSSFNSLIGRVGGEDRQRLASHADLIRGIENQLRAPVAAGCNPHMMSLPGGYNPLHQDFDNVTTTAQLDNIVLALSCDLTRVATFQFLEYHGPTFAWLGANVPGAWENWHAMVHSGQSDPPSIATMTQVFAWHTEQVAYLLNRMDQVIEADGTTMLDNSLVVWVSEFGDGGTHSTTQLPVVLAGGLGGRLRTGRHLSMTGRSTGDLFTTILNLFGHEVSSFGLNTSLSGAQLNRGPLDLS